MATNKRTKQTALTVKKRLKATEISLIITVCFLAAAISALCAIGGIYATELAALVSGETLYNVGDLDEAEHDGYNNALAEFRKIGVGDVLGGLYCNTAVEPNFNELDWESEEVLDFNIPGNAHIKMIFLCGNNAENANMLMVMYYVNKETFSLTLDSAPIYNALDDNGNVVQAGWIPPVKVSDGLPGSEHNDRYLSKDNFTFFTDKKATYVTLISTQQEIWGKWVSKLAFESEVQI